MGAFAFGCTILFSRTVARDQLAPSVALGIRFGVAGCILSLVEAVRANREPTYGALQGRLDQELILALRASAAQGGQPVTLPLDPAQQAV